MMPRSRAALVIFSERMTGSELADVIGAEPDKQWEKGAQRASDPKHGTHKAAGVEYTSRCDRSMPPDAHAEELGQRLLGGLERIGRLRDEYGVEMRCWIYHESDELMVGFDLSPSSLEPFTSAGCFIAVSVDFVGEVVEPSPPENE